MHYDTAHHQRTSNYFWLLISISALLFFPIFSVFFQGYTNFIFRVLASVIIIGGAYVVTQNKRELIICLCLGVLALIGFWIEQPQVWAQSGATIFRTLTGFVYFAYLGLRITKQLIQSKNQVNLNLIYGAIICYLLIGIIGAELCILMDVSTPGTFFEKQIDVNNYQYYYYSIVTLTTVGYGDISPSTDAGRALSILIGLIGQIYLTIIMAIIIGKYLNGQNGHN